MNREHIFSIVTSLILFASVPLVLAWTGPQWASPDAGNVPAPINVSNAGQLKSGFLNLYGPAAGLGVSPNSSYSVASNLLVGVNGNVGAKKYCNETGTICRSIEELIGDTIVINEGDCKYEQKTSTVTIKSAAGDGGVDKDLIKTLTPGTWTVGGSGTFKYCGHGCYTMAMAIRYTKNGAYVPDNKSNPPANAATYPENLFHKYWTASVTKYDWTIPAKTFTLTQEERLETYAAQGYLDGTLTITGPQLVCKN